MGVVNKNAIRKKVEKNKADLLEGSLTNDDLKKIHRHPIVIKKAEEAKRILGKA